MTTEVAARPVRGWVAVAAVTLGIFALMTSELLPVGLLTPVGAALGVSEGVAGLMVTVPGLVAAVSAPLVTVATGRLDRRLVLGLLVGLVGAANLMSAFATDFAVVLVARFLIGISVGGFWSVAGGIALRLVPAHHVPRAPRHRGDLRRRGDGVGAGCAGRNPAGRPRRVADGVRRGRCAGPGRAGGAVAAHLDGGAPAPRPLTAPLPLPGADLGRFATLGGGRSS
ncbi:MFS transporter [Actinoplanes hulinensis]|uniref:MFS transporter n=1 Tax=Actinoplanes hulinensis TaxID=1144547 RepID=A0ABS7B1Z1_9ACTN|nr:MFS transporter [Actinoplanes hulinensis]MBW6435055.1 MFS transporter [Actinoplanes hulinensis]